MRFVAHLLVPMLLAIPFSSQASDVAPRDRVAQNSSEVDQALALEVERLSDILRSPLVFGERLPGAAFLAVWFSRDAKPHRSAIHALVQTAHPDAALVLAEVLADPDFPYRHEAMAGLAKLPNLVGVPPLLETLQDSDPSLVRVAAQVLGVIISNELAVTGRNDLEEPLGSLTTSTVAALKSVLRDAREPELRVAALHSLVAIGTEGSMSLAFELAIKDPHFLVRCGLLSSSLSFIGMPRETGARRLPILKVLRNSLDPDSMDQAVGVLLRAYYDAQNYSTISSKTDCVDVHQTAMSELAWMHDPAARPSLMRASQVSDPELRATAAFGLAQYDDDAAHAIVVAALDDPLWGVRKLAIKGLGKSGHAMADTQLASVLKRGNRLDRREAARSLAGSFGASVSLIDAFDDLAVEVRNEAEAALLRSDEVVAGLELAVLRSEREEPTESNALALETRREKLAKGLEAWRLERRAAERALGEGLSHPDPRVRIRSARVLARYKSEESLALLIDALATEVAPKSETAALALGLKGDRRARAPLERAAGAADEDLAVAAVRALQDLRDPSCLPFLRKLKSGGGTKRLITAAHYAIAMLESAAASAVPAYNGSR